MVENSIPFRFRLRYIVRDDGCRTWAVVQEGELSEDITFVHCLHHLLLTLDQLGAIQSALLDDEEEVTVVALADDPLARLPRSLGHSELLN